MYVKAAMPSRPLVHLANLEKALGDVSTSARVRWVSGGSD